MDRLSKCILDRNEGYWALRSGRFSESGGAYHLTSSVQQERGPLSPLARASMMRCLLEWQVTVGFLRVVFALMPDHIHLLGLLMGDTTLARLMGRYKAYSSATVNRQESCVGTPLWQEGFYDKRMRNEQQLEATAFYIEDNAVRAELVSSPELYPFSSAHPRFRQELQGRLWLEE